MASFTPSKLPKPISIDKFLGINEAVAETEIKTGETVKQVNFRITKDYKAEKRSGYTTLIDYENSKNVYFWHGTIDGTEYIISTNDGKIYEKELPDGTNTQIGTLTDAFTSFFQFNGTLYIQTGTDYKSYDGTTYGDVIPYVPIIAIGTSPAGGGTTFEEINLLTGLKWQYFVGDGASTSFQLRETSIDATLVVVTIDGVTKTEGTHFTVNRTTGVVDFSAGTSPHGAPADESDVCIKWDKVASGAADEIKNCKYNVIFGVGNDTTVFVWGNQNYKNRFYRSGVSDPTYFPATNFNTVGTTDTAVTSLIPHYDRLVIFKEERSYYSYAETNPNYADNEGLNPYIYVVRDLNEKIGNVAYGGAQLVENYPLSLKSHSLWKWTSTQVEDERNATNISGRMKYTLADYDLSTAVTFDYQKEKELWVNVGDEVVIWNYENDTFYMYDNISAKQFIEVDGVVYFSTAGTIEYMGGTSDNGSAITAELELGFMDFGVNELLKNSRKIWVEIKPASNTSVEITYATNKQNLGDSKILTVGYYSYSYASIDYSHWTYLTNTNPQTARLKIRAKKFSVIKFAFKNEEINETLVILSLKVLAETTSEVK